MSSKNSISLLGDASSMEQTDNKSSKIPAYFAGKKILLTGGSGFLGRLLLEKLLRTCPDIECVYMFMREKRGLSPEERFREYFDDVIFERLRKERPKAEEKVILMRADTSEVGLGMSAENRERLKDTDIIFHGAATVRFDEKLRTAVNINIRGTKELLLIAREIPTLKAFVHISTAFSNCVWKTIEEKFYEPPIREDKILALIDALDDQQLAMITPQLLGKWPNTYAFTKAIAEDAVRRYLTGIPTCIVRPSIMIATDKEPIRGWINNLYGPTGVCVGAAYGILRTLCLDKAKVADIIPADYVINNIIVAAWDVAQKRTVPPSITDANENVKVSTVEEMPIYNCVSSAQNPITWGEFTTLNKTYGFEIPSDKVFWYYFLLATTNPFLFAVYTFFLHTVPAVIIDTLAYLTGRKRMLVNIYKKVNKFGGVLKYFSTQEWHFKNDHVLRLWDRTSEKDRKLFNFNVGSLIWEEYMRYHIRGIRIYIVHDPLDTIERGRSKYRILKIAHYTVVTMVFLLLFWIMFALLKLFGRLLFSF